MVIHMQKFICFLISAVTFAVMAAGIAPQVFADDYTPDEGSVQVYDPALYEKLDTLQNSIDSLTDSAAPVEDSETIDYTETLNTISAQLADLQEMAHAATAETAQVSAFEKPFEEYDTKESLMLITCAVVILCAVFWLLHTFLL